MHNMLIRPTANELADFEPPDFVIFNAGQFPASEALLRELPGIGAYTAAAVAAIGFGLKATPLDGNIERSRNTDLFH